MSEVIQEKRLPACPVEVTLTLISNKWKVHSHSAGFIARAKRLGELKKSIGTVTEGPDMQLRGTGASGLLTRTRV